MTDLIDQARSGSLAAIIQLLNEQLSPSGVRTRAVLDKGVLLLLCEAQTLEQLEQSTLVSQIRQILESIGLTNIYRVKINSRLVKEEQLLWLEDINRNQANLIWYEEIKLTRPSILNQIVMVWETWNLASSNQSTKHKYVSTNRDLGLYWKGLIGGISISLLLVLITWGVFHWFKTNPNHLAIPTSKPIVKDPFSQAVNIAQATAVASAQATSKQEWFNISLQWKKASDLMGAVPITDRRYQIAQNRMVDYRNNSQSARKRAKQLK